MESPMKKKTELKRTKTEDDSLESGNDRAKKLKTDSEYGARFQEDWPTRDFKPNWIDNETAVVNKPKLMDLETLLKKSVEFPIPFPTETGRCKSIKNVISKEEMERNINSTYPILHEKVLELYSNFLELKREFGTAVEKEVYKDMGVVQLVNRLLKNRAVSFWAANDKWQLMSKESGIAGWERVGTDEEKPPLLLKDVISYDEIKISALLYVSGYSYFVNNGYRQNCGVTEKDRSSVEKEGIIIGLIGARLKRKQLMEYQDTIVTKEQNSPQNGYTNDTLSDETAVGKQKLRKLWADFYEEEINNFSKVENIVKNKTEGNHYSPARAKNAYFDNMYYKKRLSIAFDALIFEANYRAKKASKMAFIHMVGIGLGVWKNSAHQEPAFVEVFIQRLKALRNHTRNIADVHFAYFRTWPVDLVKNNPQISDSKHPNDGVKIHISKREPFTRLTGEHEGKLLIATYAWDGNAQPGNEYWCKMLKSTGDSSTACSTQVAELHNAHINTKNVCGENLRVASRRHGLLSYADYVKKCQEQ